MREIVTRIDIDAPPAEVWQVLVDFASYPDWNPLIRFIDGPTEEGAQLNMTLAPAGLKAKHVRPSVTRIERGRELRFKRRALLPGLFDREQALIVEARGEQGTRFVHRERFTGMFVPLFWGDVREGTRLAFELMNRALKIRAERGG